DPAGPDVSRVVPVAPAIDPPPARPPAENTRAAGASALTSVLTPLTIAPVSARPVSVKANGTGPDSVSIVCSTPVQLEAWIVYVGNQSMNDDEVMRMSWSPAPGAGFTSASRSRYQRLVLLSPASARCPAGCIRWEPRWTLAGGTPRLSLTA